MSELYLSRLRLDPRQPAVQQALANSQLLHHQVMSAFPDAGGQGREAYSVLFRVEIDAASGRPTLLVQSAARPNWEGSSANSLLSSGTDVPCKEVTAFYAAIALGQHLRFRLRANPTRRVHASRTGDKLAGKRVELRTDEQRQAWIARKLQGAGCELIGCVIRDEPTQHGVREGKRVAHGAATFDGVLRVTDPSLLQAAIRQGIGSGKAYGFGLLSVAPV
jgi:CRISPR system Cascade subunit CasE